MSADRAQVVTCQQFSGPLTADGMPTLNAFGHAVHRLMQVSHVGLMLVNIEKVLRGC